MKASLLRENLALAARLKSKKDLKKALHDYVDSGLPTDECVEYEEALREYDVIKTRDGACCCDVTLISCSLLISQ